MLFVPGPPERALSVPRHTGQWSAEPGWLADKRAAIAELWSRFNPQNLIAEIDTLLLIQGFFNV